MARTKGAKNKRKMFKPIDEHKYTDEEIFFAKQNIMDMLMKGEASSIADAARKMNIHPARAHDWCRCDKDFQALLRECKEVFADDLEVELRHHPNFIPKMMILKGYRPEFRDNARLDVKSDGLEKLIKELKEINEKQAAPKMEEAAKESVCK